MIEYNHRIQTVAVGMNRVVDVDVALCILADAVGVAILDGARQLAPVMNRLALILALPENRGFAAGLFGWVQECGSASNSCAADQEFTTADWHDGILQTA
jgi:hypothetical protein